LGSERVMIAPSSSLLHVPVDLELEDKLDPQIKNWMAFSKQKLYEINDLYEIIENKNESLFKKIKRI